MSAAANTLQNIGDLLKKTYPKSSKFARLKKKLKSK